MKDFAFYFDMDGVLADYDTGIENRGFKIDRSLKNQLNRSGTGNPLKLEMYKHIQGTNFYATLPVMPGAFDLWKHCEGAERGIITAAPKFGGTEENYYLNPHWLGAAYHKRWWMENLFLPQAAWWPNRSIIRHLPMADERFICTTSIQKHKFIGRIDKPHQVLIDDRIDNCRDWARAGGISILHGGDANEVLDYIDWLTTCTDEMISMASGHGFVMGIDGQPMNIFLKRKEAAE
jgi:hypothetical protein